MSYYTKDEIECTSGFNACEYLVKCNKDYTSESFSTGCKYEGLILRRIQYRYKGEIISVVVLQDEKPIRYSETTKELK